MALRARRWLFAVYVLLLCALALSDPSLQRGAALFLLTLGVVLLVRDIDIDAELEPTNAARDNPSDEHERR